MEKIIKSISFKIFITVFILIALHSAPNGSQSDRYIVTVSSLVETGSFALQAGLTRPVDVVEINNNFYSVIAPGLPIIFAPIYYINRFIMNMIGVPFGEVFWGCFHILSNIFITAPILATAAVAMFNTLKYLTTQTYKQLLLVFIFIFGSLAFFYSTNGIWVHAYTMSLIFIAFSLIVSRKNDFLIGIIMGIAQIIDYVSVLPIFWLMGFWSYKNYNRGIKTFISKSIYLFLGYGIFLTGLIYYNYIITGSPIQTPNSIFLQNAVQQGRANYPSMFISPSFASLWGLSFSPFRGIFLYYPMMFLFIWTLLKKKFDHHKIMLFSFLFVGFTFLFNTTYYAWSGDSCFGPRHLVMAMPFVILPIANCSTKYIKIFGFISIFINLAGVSTVPSDNIFKNITIFLYRGPFLQWLDWIHKVILPTYNINLSSVTPFFIYVIVFYGGYLIWKPVKDEFITSLSKSS